MIETEERGTRDGKIRLNNTTEILTRREAAAFLKVHRATLDRLAAAGKLPYIKLGTSQSCKVLYDKADLIEYLERHRVDISGQTEKLRATLKRRTEQ